MRASLPVPATLALAGALGLAAPAVAGAQAAPAILPAQPCVLEQGLLGATVTGLAPGTAVRVGFANTFAQPAGIVGPDGALALTGIPAPAGGLADKQTHATETFALGLFPATTAYATPPLTTVPVTVAQRNAFLLPSVADVKRVRTIDAAGLVPGARAYIHVRIDGRWRRTTSLGTAGACGEVRVRRAFLKGLGKLPATATAYAYIDSVKRPSLKTRPQAEVQMRLRRVFRGVYPNYLVETALRLFHAS